MERDINQLMRIMRLSAQIVLENGGETYRAEETVHYIGNSLGIAEIDSLAIPTGIYITISMDGRENQTTVKRINRRGVNLQKLNGVNTISRQISNHEITLEEAEEKLKEIKAAPQDQPLLGLLYGAISTAFFTLLFGGGLFDFATAFLIGFLVALINTKLQGVHSQHFASNIVNGAVITAMAIGGTSLFGRGTYQLIILGGMMPQLPGLAMINAIRDTIRGDLVSGAARTAEVLLISASLAIGSGVILSLAYRLNWIMV